MLAVSCVSQPSAETQDKKNSSFARVKPVLERNCVHCHASNRLSGMPALSDTKSLAGLIGPGNLIMPGKPEQSRFYQVTTLSDDQAGAMPPTGHAISSREATILREWIQGGAALPVDTIKLNPVGTAPRSR